MKTVQNLLLTALMIVLLAACTNGQAQTDTFTIGIVRSNLTGPGYVVDGFKAGLAAQGYVEGENISYRDILETNEEDTEAFTKELLAVNADLILVLGVDRALTVKQVVSGTDIPVVFTLAYDPVKTGLVDSLIDPGENLTGIKTGGHMTKVLDWHLALAPDTKLIFVLHDPTHIASVQSLAELQEGATKFGIDILVQEVRTSDEVTTALDALPKDIDSILLLPAGLLIRNVDQFVEAAVEHNLPLTSGVPLYSQGLPLTYGIDFFQVGEQASKITIRLLKGAFPTDLPVETAEFYLGINLQTAETIGLDISDEILDQANYIIR